MTTPLPLQVPDELWDSLACLPSLAYLEIAVHLWPGNPVVLDSRVWQRLAACTQLDRLRLAKGFVDSLEGTYGGESKRNAATHVAGVCTCWAAANLQLPSTERLPLRCCYAVLIPLECRRV